MTIELLVVPNCPNSTAAGTLLQQALSELGRDEAGWAQVVVEDHEAADKLGFTGSPSFHVHGRDVFPQPVAPAVACRLYRTPCAKSGLPAASELAAALSSALGSTLELPADPKPQA